MAATKGNSGGGGLAAAGHLYNWDALPGVIAPDTPLKTPALAQLEVLRKSSAPIALGEGEFGPVAGPFSSKSIAVGPSRVSSKEATVAFDTIGGNER